MAPRLEVKIDWNGEALVGEVREQVSDELVQATDNIARGARSRAGAFSSRYADTIRSEQGKKSGGVLTGNPTPAYVITGEDTKEIAATVIEKGSAHNQPHDTVLPEYDRELPGLTQRLTDII